MSSQQDKSLGILRASWNLGHSRDSVLSSFCKALLEVLTFVCSRASTSWLNLSLCPSAAFSLLLALRLSVLAVIPVHPSHPRGDVWTWCLSYDEQHVSSPMAQSSSGWAHGRAHPESRHQQGLSSTSTDAQPSCCCAGALLPTPYCLKLPREMLWAGSPGLISKEEIST